MAGPDSTDWSVRGQARDSGVQDKVLLNVMGRCLDVAGGVNANRTNIQLFDCNGTNSQKWRKP